MNGSANKRLPSGFAGPILRRRDVQPEGETILRLPEQGVAEGPFTRVPDGSFDAVVIDGVRDSMGNLRGFLQQIARTLPPGGGVVLDICNLQGPHTLHRVIEGRAGSFEPAGSPRDPERGILLKDALVAMETAGLVVEDCIAVPPITTELQPDFAREMFDQGFVAGAAMASHPPARYWLTAHRGTMAPGAVVIGPGSHADQQHTRQVLAAFLPSDWELRLATEDDEVEAFNRGIHACHAELVWFLRAGSTPSLALFENSLTTALTNPAVPEGLQEVSAGLCGIMLQRRVALQTGPVHDTWRCADVAFEEYGMRLSAIDRAPRPVPGAIECPATRVDDVQALREESDQLVEHWEPLLNRPFRGERTPETREATPVTPPWEGREPRVSLCMIARDEEKVLATCLASAAGAVDEIILVDTGSNDRTVAIAEAYGARVLHTEWTDDFATARNMGLEAATGDWILVLDADENLVAGSSEEIRDLVRDPGVCGYHLVLRNVYDGGTTQGVRMVRLFRNLEGARFQNRIHEQITPTLTATGSEHGLILSSCDVELEHVGYRDEIMRARNKDERNERLFRIEIEEHPDDIYMLYKFGDFLRRLPERRAECLEVLDQARELVFELPLPALRSIPYAGEIAALSALEHAKEGRMELADAIIDRAFARLVPTPNLHYIAAGMALAAGRNDDAIEHYRRCLEYGDQVLVVPIQEGITGHVSITGMAQACLQKGDWAMARQLLERSIAMCPEWEVSILTLSRLHFHQHDFNRAVQVLTEYLAEHPNSAGACQQATIMLGKLGMTDQARAIGERAIDLLERSSCTADAQRMKETVAALA